MATTILIIVGVAVLLGAGVGYLLSNPQRVRDLAEQIKTFRKSVNDLGQLAVETRASMTRTPSGAPVDDQFQDLHLGETVEILPDRTNILERIERSVTCRGTLCTLNRTGRDFTDRGENWLMLVLDDTTMLFQRPDGWFWFDRENADVLDGESASKFDEAGNTFSERYNQEPRSYSFKWDGQKLTILDVGYLRFEITEGRCHLPHCMMVKYMLAEDAQGNIVYLENIKVGTDRVWKMGHALGMSIKPYCGKILRAA